MRPMYNLTLMRAIYRSIYKISGAASLKAGLDGQIVFTGTNPAIQAIITSNLEAHTDHIDRFSASLKGLGCAWGSSTGKTTEQWVADEAASIKAARLAKYPSGVFVVFTGETDIDPEFRHRTQLNGYAFDSCRDDHVPQKIRNVFLPIESAVLSAYMLSNPSPTPDHRYEDLAWAPYFMDGAMVVYPLQIVFPPMRGSTAHPISEDVLLDMRHVAEQLVQMTYLQKPLRLLRSSLKKGSDPLPVFLNAWAALEMFVQKAFSSIYRAQFLTLTQQNPPAWSTPILKKAQEQGKQPQQYHVADKFLVIAHILNPAEAASDYDHFNEFNRRRNALFHEVESTTNPTDEIQALLVKYLKLHLNSPISAPSQTWWKKMLEQFLEWVRKIRS